MYNLKVTKPDGSIEQSEFVTNEEAVNWQTHLESIGYIGTFEISSINPPIEDISPRQIRMALLSQGLTEAAIDSAINTLSSPSKEQAMIAWKYSTTFKRSEVAVAMIGALLSLSSEQLDGVWKIGSNL
jgi:hypothetical protein